MRHDVHIDDYCFYADRGSSGSVSLAVEVATGQRVAIKQIPVRPRFRAAAVLRELENQRLCRGHPHIIQLQVSFFPMHLSALMQARRMPRLDENMRSLMPVTGSVPVRGPTSASSWSWRKVAILRPTWSR